MKTAHAVKPNETSRLQVARWSSSCRSRSRTCACRSARTTSARARAFSARCSSCSAPPAPD